MLDLNVSRETYDRIDLFEDMVVVEADQQNLISSTTLGDIKHRHSMDSLQLLQHDQDGLWIDVGTGAGYPGMVVAIGRTDPVLMVEPRRLRAEFLESARSKLGLTHASVVQKSIYSVEADASVISGRAVAKLAKFFDMTEHLVGPDTRYVLHKGRNVHLELEQANRLWHGDFKTVPSVTDSESRIVIAEKVRRRGS